MKESITRELLFDFFDGRATTLQQKLLEDWLQIPASEEVFYSYLDEWERQHPQFKPEQEQAYAYYQQLLAGETLPGRPERLAPEIRRQAGIGSRTWIKAGLAASIVLLTGFIFRTELLYKSYKAPIGATTSMLLDDSTQVILNSNSTLLVPRFGFSKGVREVELAGEAEFNVKHTKSHQPFRVKLGNDFQIEVLGTEFTAFSRERGKRVFLESGSVKLKLPAGKLLYMQPGHYFEADKDGTYQVTIPREPQAITAWKEHLFLFNNTALAEVAEQIQERFNVQIVIPDSALASRKIGGIYRARQVDELLQVLTELLELEIIHHADHIELRISLTSNL